MDKKVKLKLKEYNRALKSFEDALLMDFKSQEIIRDGLVQRFEITYELMIKVVRIFLLEKGINSIAPKDLIRIFSADREVKDSQTETLLKIVDDRNRTTHDYNQKFIKSLVSRLAKYHKVMSEVANQIGQDMES